MGPVGRHIRKSLRRRIFWWFVATIFITSGAVGLAMGVMMHAGGSSWWRDYERLQRYVGSEIAQSGDDPAPRDRKLTEVAQTFDVDAELLRPDGTLLLRVGDPCPHP